MLIELELSKADRSLSYDLIDIYEQIVGPRPIERCGQQTIVAVMNCKWNSETKS